MSTARTLQNERGWFEEVPLRVLFTYNAKMIKSGTAATLFQSVFYGAFTPAAGIFATLTSIAMTGRLLWPAVVFAAVLATIIAAVVWVAGTGR